MGGSCTIASRGVVPRAPPLASDLCTVRTASGHRAVCAAPCAATGPLSLSPTPVGAGHFIDRANSAVCSKGTRLSGMGVVPAAGAPRPLDGRGRAHRGRGMGWRSGSGGSGALGGCACDGRGGCARGGLDADGCAAGRCAQRCGSSTATLQTPGRAGAKSAAAWVHRDRVPRAVAAVHRVPPHRGDERQCCRSAARAHASSRVRP